MTEQVAVIVPHYNDLHGLDRCLSELMRQTLPRERFAIIVSDNASPCGEAAVRARIADRARLVISHERGAGPTRNAGVAASSAPIIAFTDSDCVPNPGWLEHGLAALAHHDIVGGQVEVLVGDPARKTGEEAFEQVFAFKNEEYIRDQRFSVSANLFCRRDVFDAVGPFRPAISEDLEWCNRAVAKGFTLGYAGAAVVGHPARGDWAALIAKWRRMTRETYIMAGPSRAARLAWLARHWLMPVSVVAHAPAVLRSPALHGGRERRAALRILVRQRLWRMAEAHRLFFGGR